MDDGPKGRYGSATSQIADSLGAWLFNLDRRNWEPHYLRRYCLISTVSTSISGRMRAGARY